MSKLQLTITNSTHQSMVEDTHHIPTLTIRTKYDHRQEHGLYLYRYPYRQVIKCYYDQSIKIWCNK